jgi:hypothetical protein
LSRRGAPAVAQPSAASHDSSVGMQRSSTPARVRSGCAASCAPKHRQRRAVTACKYSHAAACLPRRALADVHDKQRDACGSGSGHDGGHRAPAVRAPGLAGGGVVARCEENVRRGQAEQARSRKGERSHARDGGRRRRKAPRAQIAILRVDAMLVSGCTTQEVRRQRSSGSVAPLGRR